MLRRLICTFERNKQMNYQEKLEALNCLAECSLKMREPGDWCVEQDVMVGDGSGTGVSAVGNGPTPFDAVEDHWKLVTTNMADWCYIIANEKHWKWDKFMWKRV